MNETITTRITNCIERIYSMGGLANRIILFPCGDVGIQTISVMKSVYAITPAYVIDNRKYDLEIHDTDFLWGMDRSGYVLMLASCNPNIYYQLYSIASSLFEEERIVELDGM